MSRALAVLALLVLPFLAAAQQPQAPTPPAPPATPRLKIGVALEGGGALGLAHIGVLEWFEENHIPVDRIAGTSMGSMVGAMYASGQSIAAVKKLVARNEFNDMFALRPAYSRLGFRRRQDRSELPQAISLGLKGGRVSFGNALISDDRLDTFLTDEF